MYFFVPFSDFSYQTSCNIIYVLVHVEFITLSTVTQIYRFCRSCIYYLPFSYCIHLTYFLFYFHFYGPINHQSRSQYIFHPLSKIGKRPITFLCERKEFITQQSQQYTAYHFQSFKWRENILWQTDLILLLL